MNLINFITDMRSIMTVLCLLVFLGIVYWSYSAGRKDDFAAAASLPFADEFADAGLPAAATEAPHG
ncbi:cbb3-type cytochrome oxidase subunit 3 [Undibacterium sp. TJN25]|uniref:cbb3-type cytochrome oxidase subunit 3 n=1 Tax=Undibacterium sp. TJN25 TaxID=3413056 RepID=UPI003BF1ADD8